MIHLSFYSISSLFLFVIGSFTFSTLSTNIDYSTVVDDDNYYGSCSAMTYSLTSETGDSFGTVTLSARNNTLMISYTLSEADWNIDKTSVQINEAMREGEKIFEENSVERKVVQKRIQFEQDVFKNGAEIGIKLDSDFINETSGERTSVYAFPESTDWNNIAALRQEYEEIIFICNMPTRRIEINSDGW